MAAIIPGIIFDWDGVIIDSAGQHEESWERLAKSEGRTLPPDHFKDGFGRKNEWIIQHLLGWSSTPAEISRLSLLKEALYRDIVVERGLEPMPGVRVFLDRLQAGQVPCCIGSSTHRANITTILGVLGLPAYFPAMVTAEDVSHGKPHPEVFLKAAEKLNRPPSHCIVFEDAYAGIEAARAGGMKVVGVASTHPSAALAAKVDRVVHRLDELTVQDLCRLIAG